MKELDEIDNEICRILISLLLRIVPEYNIFYKQERLENDLPENGIYLFMNSFATHLSEEFMKTPNSDLVKNSFKYINNIGESYNLEVLNILRVGILEILYTTKGLNRSEVSNMLSEKIQNYFNDFSRFYR